MPESAWWRGSLSADGVLGAIFTGTGAFVAGIAWAAVLIVFFVSSTLLSKVHSAQKKAAREQFSKGERRDLRQVLANGGIGAVLAILFILLDESSLWAAYLGALAAVNADTWATEIGTWRGEKPRLISTLRFVEVGRSGGVTATGVLLGALTIGVVGSVLLTSQPALIFIVTTAGFAGSLIDSLLGATLQGQFGCADVARISERQIWPDGSPAKLHSGRAWINNEVVNFAASAGGALIAWSLAQILLNG